MAMRKARVLGQWTGLLAALAVMSCSKTTSGPTAPPEPPPPVETEFEAVDAEEETPFDKNTYISTHNNEDAREAADAESEPKVEPEPEPEQQFAVTTPAAAKERAQAAISDELMGLDDWRASPVLPTQWPAKDRSVVVFFYPLRSNPPSLTEFRLMSPAFAVTVSLESGEATVEAMAKKKKLGTIKEQRATSLERRELDMAEAALVRQLLGYDIDAGAKPYWGYLKYVHEHDKLGRDLQRRSPAFFSWLKRKHGR